MRPGVGWNTFRATGMLLSDRPYVRIETKFAQDVAGLHEKAGGSGAEAGSGDLLLKLTERYCVIVPTLRTPPQLSATLRRSGG